MYFSGNTIAQAIRENPEFTLVKVDPLSAISQGKVVLIYNNKKYICHLAGIFSFCGGFSMKFKSNTPKPVIQFFLDLLTGNKWLGNYTFCILTVGNEVKFIRREKNDN